MEKLVETRLEALERTTSEAIRKIMTNPGVQSPEYIDKFNAIMDNYRLSWQVLMDLKPTHYD